MKRGRPFEWTDEKVEQLKSLAADGKLSMSAMGAELGVSRCAVIGKLFRLNIKAAPLSTERQLQIRQRREERAPKPVREPKIKTVSPKPTPFAQPLNIPFADLRSFSNLQPNECRFIASEPPGPLYLACGNETAAGESYCAHCKQITHRVSFEITDEERSRRAAQMRKFAKPATIAALDIIDEAA